MKLEYSDTQHWTGARRVVVSLSCSAYHKMLRLLPNRGLVGSQGLKRTLKKYAQRRRFRRNSLPNEDFRLKRLYQPQTKLAFLQIQSSNSFWKNEFGALILSFVFFEKHFLARKMGQNKRFFVFFIFFDRQFQLTSNTMLGT